jgi:predicted ATPase
MERALGFARNESPASRVARLEAMVMQRFKGSAQDANLIGRLFNLPVERYGPLEMTPQKQKEEMARALVDIARNGSQQNPLLVLYEDLHWADPSTIELLDQLFRRTDMRALVVMTYRPEFKPPWIGQPQVTQLTLSRLNAEQTAQVARRVAGGRELPDEMVSQIVLKTDGIPLFIEELTKAILESSIITRREDRYVLTGPLTSLAIPATLHDSLMARLDRLSPSKEVAQIGACIGREFSHELLALVSALPAQHSLGGDHA